MLLICPNYRITFTFHRVLSVCVCVCVCVCKLLHLCSLCDPLDCSPPGSSVHGILQARILEWIAMPPPGDLPEPGVEPTSIMFPVSAGVCFTTSATWGARIISNGNQT